MARKRKNPRPKNPAAVSLAKLRWKNTTREERQKIARKAALARWRKKP